MKTSSGVTLEFLLILQTTQVVVVVEVSAAMAEYNTNGTFTGTPLGGPGNTWMTMDMLFIVGIHAG
jgi:hypothetical protein